MKWGRMRKKHDRKSTPPSASPGCPLLSSWFSGFKKSDRRPPDPEQDEGGSLLVPIKIDNSHELNARERETEPNSRAPTGMKVRAVMKPTEEQQQLPSVQDQGSSPGDGKLQRESSQSARESKSLRSMRRRVRHVKVRSPKPNSAVNVRQSNKGRGSGRDYERYALVKCSYDPQGDFRESMMEIIAARGIGCTAAEMEELLASYLILNDDTYHDVIIKVFRQVWFELDRRGFWGDNYDVVGEDQRRASSSGQV